MRILLDTNIIILREDHKVVDDDLQMLFQNIQKLDYKILLHPKSIEDIKRDPDDQRKKITLSKFKTYEILEAAPNPNTDLMYLEIIGAPRKENDEIDDYLLFSVYKNAVNFLITEDLGLHRKAKKARLSERVLNVIEALDLFKKGLPQDVKLPPALYQTTLASLDVNDPIFNSLREDYFNFDEWYAKKSRDGRECWIYRKNDGYLGAVLIYKLENEVILSKPPLKKKIRLKISTMKVSQEGYKIGELLLKLSFNLAIKNNIPEIYLTHFIRENDYLVNLIEDYGFKKVSIINQSWTDIPEDLFLKKVLINKEDIYGLSPLEISKNYYPNLYDGEKVRKFIVPILPIYFKRLHTDFPEEQTTLNGYLGQLKIQGNTIKKAYLCHSSSKKMNIGGLLLFYRSKDTQSVLSIGVIERVEYDMRDPTEIISIVGKRTVYSPAEIERISKSDTTIILFNHHFHFKKPIIYKKLLNIGILRGPPQSITEINHNNYIKIKKIGGINERFTFD